MSVVHIQRHLWVIEMHSFRFVNIRKCRCSTISLHCILMTNIWTRCSQGYRYNEWPWGTVAIWLRNHTQAVCHQLEWSELSLSSACVKMIGCPLLNIVAIIKMQKFQVTVCVLLLLVATIKKQDISVILVGPLLEQCWAASFCVPSAKSERSPKLTAKWHTVAYVHFTFTFILSLMILYTLIFILVKVFRIST